MATAKRSKKRKKAAASGTQRNSARRRSTKKNAAVGRRRRVQRNPAGYGMAELAVLGGGAVVGSTLPRMASQFFLGSRNTGMVGYIANLSGTVLLAVAANALLPRQRMFGIGVLAGGIGQVISRAISDYTSFGQFLNNAGMGDYMAANWVTPQRLPDALNSAMSENGWSAPPPVAIASATPPSVAAGGGVGALIGAPLY